MPLRLEDVAVPLAGAVGKNFLGIPTSCHIATLFWLHHATYGALPTEIKEPFLSKLGQFAPILARMAKRGVQLTPKHRLDVPLVPGSVLIFEQNGEARHSCTVKTTRTIAGYNQTQWFREGGGRTLGVDHGYSIHQMVDIDWVQPFPSSTVKGGAYVCRLMMVPQAAALEEFQR